MPIVLYLGANIKEYEAKSEGIIIQGIDEGRFLCEKCLRPMWRHSSYRRGIKETGEKIEITIVWCRDCEAGHSLLPDFLLPNKHYSGNEIESVVIDSATEPANRIETEASESTVRRWIKQIGERIRRTVGILKLLFGRGNHAVNEIAIEPGPPYSELEQVLEMASFDVKCCGNRLGLANMWLGTAGLPTFI